MATAPKTKKITPEDRLAYKTGIEELDAEISKIKEKLAHLENEVGRLKNDDPHDLIYYYHISTANEHLELVKLHAEKSKINETYLRKKNDDFLNEARKAYFKALLEMETFLGTIIDTSLSEMKETLDLIPKMDPLRVVTLYKKFRDNLTLITEGYGQNTKYTWSFVDMEARYVCCMKNLMNWRELAINDPRNIFYQENYELIVKIKLDIQNSAKKLQEKYQLAGNEKENLVQAIRFMSALRSIHILLNEQNEAEIAKKTTDSWNKMLKAHDARMKKKGRK